VARLLEATHRSDGYPVVLLDDLEAWAAGTDVLEAWVAVDPDAGGEVVGHVALTEAGHDEATDQWAAATGLGRDRLGVVRRLVVRRRMHGTGTGAALLQTAVDAAHALGRRPVLDMADNLEAAGRLYERAGFERIGAYDLELVEHERDAGSAMPGGSRLHRLHVLTWIGPEASS
jgi:GNAT superfamily N-acetyltransferase